jgi:NADPH:quinone reductase-like Zn-dependent oxidoreductase
MLAIEITRHGGPEALQPVERPEPVPSADEVLVRNRWIGVNYVDLLSRLWQLRQHRRGVLPDARAGGEGAVGVPWVRERERREGWVP